MTAVGREAAILVVAGAGLGALVLAGVPSWIGAAALLLVLVSPWLREPLAAVPWGLLTGGAVLAFGVLVARGAALSGLGGLLAWLVAQRFLARRGPGDDRVVILLAAVMLVLAGALGQQAAFAVPLALWAVAAPLGLLWGALGEGDDAWADLVRWVPVPVAVLALSAALFLLVPRWGSAPAPQPVAPALTGFAPEVALGDMDVLLDDPTPALRVRVTGDLEGPLRLRGSVLDGFDGRRWLHTTAPEAWAGLGDGDLRLDVIEESAVDNVLFSLGDPVRVEAPGARVLRDGDGALWAVRPDRPLRYTVWSRAAPAPTPLDDAERVRLTALPEGLDPRVVALAAEIAPPDLADAEAAEAIRRWLAAEMAYTRAPRDAQVEAPLSVFLFERRTGHCEYFATAAVALARARGIPARLVQGFAGGEYNEVGGYWLFRRAHAHAWAEVHAGDTWQILDATPGPDAPAPPPTAVRWADGVRTLWEERVVGYDHGVQVAAALRVGRAVQGVLRPGSPPAGPPWLGWGALVLGLASLGVLATRAARPRLARLAGERVEAPTGRVAIAHAEAWRDLRRRGWGPPPSLPPVAAARWVRARAGEAAEPLERLAWLHYAVRYGGADDAALAPEARALAEEATTRIPSP